MKRSMQFLVVFTILLVFISCNDDDNDSPNPTPVIVTFNTGLDGESEVPPVTTTSAYGAAVLKFNKTTKIFTLRLNTLV